MRLLSGPASRCALLQGQYPPHLHSPPCVLVCIYLHLLALTLGGHHYPRSVRGRGRLQRWQALGRRPNPGGETDLMSITYHSDTKCLTLDVRSLDMKTAEKLI